MLRRTFSGTMIALLLIAMLTVAVKINPVRTESTVITVPDDFLTIQEAIDNATEGDTIFVKEGTYYENVVVNKTVSLIGENRNTTIIDGNYSGTVVYVTKDNVKISGFTIQKDKWGWCGIFLQNANNCNITNNDVKDNSLGILLYSSSSNSISENNITNNYYGIRLSQWASSNRIYHNNFIGNTIYPETYDSESVWDDGYPSGGNYWSDFNGTDLCRGPYQDETGSDGVWDQPYVINGDNQDRYPLKKPYGGPHDIGIVNITTSKMVVGLGFNLNVTLKVVNFGVETQTFNVTAYANTTIIATIADMTATSRNSTTLTFTWNTTGFALGSYVISAYAEAVPDEMDTSDNNFTDGMVIVTHAGDVTGDGRVDIEDVARVAAAFGSILVSDPSDPKYGQYWQPIACPTCPHTPNTDITGDGKVDILDLAITSANYGHEPPKVRFVAPRDKSLVVGISVLVMCEVDASAQPVSVTINGLQANVSAWGDFWARLMIEPGPNSVVALATDSKGRVGSASMIVVSLLEGDINLPLNTPPDGLPPAAPVLDPLESPVDFPVVRVSGSVDWGTVVVTVEGGVDVVSTVVDFDTMRFGVDVRLNPGENVLGVTAADIEGLVSAPTAALITYNPRVYYDPRPVDGGFFRPASWPPASVWKTGVVFGDYLYSIVPTFWYSGDPSMPPPVLRIIDATQGWNFTVLSETLLNDTYGNPPAYRIDVGRPFVEGNRLYIAKLLNESFGAMEVYDVTDPSMPKALFKGFLPIYTGRLGAGIKVVDSIVYAPRGYDTGITIINFTKPASPQIVSNFFSATFTSSVDAVDVVGSVAYLSTNVGLLTVDVADPSHPVELGNALLPDDMLWDRYHTHLQVDGNFAYFLGGPGADVDPRYYLSGIAIFDVSDPRTPTLASGSFVTLPNSDFPSGGQMIFAGEKKGNTVYLCGRFEGGYSYMDVATVVALDVTNPYSPIVTSWVSIPSAISRIVERWPETGYDISVTEDGVFAYVTGADAIYRVKLGDEGISYSGCIFVQGSRPSISVTSIGDLLIEEETNEYIDQVRIYDISDPQAPVQLASINPHAPSTDDYWHDRQPTRIKAVGNLVYSFSRQWYRGTSPGYYEGGWYLSVLDISDPSNPIVLSDTVLGLEYNAPRDPYNIFGTGVEVSGNLAYLPLAGGMAIIDLSNPTLPRVLSQFYSSTSFSVGYDVKVSGNLAILLTEECAIMIDVSNATDPREIGFWRYPYLTWQVKKLEIFENTAFLGMLQSMVDYSTLGVYTARYNSSTLWVLNITDPSAPSLLATLDQPQFVDFQLKEIRKGDLKAFLAMPTEREGEPIQPFFGILDISEAWEFSVNKTFSDASLVRYPYDDYYWSLYEMYKGSFGLHIPEDGTAAYVASGPPVIKIVTLMQPKIKISAITPSSGHSGSIVTITGKIFSPRLADNVVTFGNVSTMVLRADERSLDVVVPYVPADNYTVNVMVQGIQSEQGFNFTLERVFLDETAFGEIAQSSFSSIATVLTELSIDMNTSDPMYQHILDLRTFINRLALNVSRFDNETKLFVDAVFASLELQALADAIAQQIRILRGTEFSDYCETARMLKISETIQKAMDLILKLISALKFVIDVIGVLTGPGEITIVLATQATFMGLVSAVRYIMGAINKIIAGEKPVFISKFIIHPSSPINLYLPEEPDFPSKRLIQVTSTWTNDPEVVGLPLTDLVGPLGDLNDLLAILGLPTIPDLPVKQYQLYEVNVPLEPGEDFTLETLIPTVVEVNTPSPGYVSAVEDGNGLVRLTVELYGLPMIALSSKAKDDLVTMGSLPVRVKEPGPTIKIIEPTGFIWEPGDTITTWVEATDGASGGNTNLKWIEYTMVGAASAHEVKSFDPPVDRATTYFSPITMPKEITSPDNAWILITVTAHDQHGRTAVARRLMKSPLAGILEIIPPYKNFLGYSFPEGEESGPFVMWFLVKETTTAGIPIDPTTINVDFGDNPTPLLGEAEFWDRVEKIKRGIIPDLAPKPGDYYVIPNRDLFKKGTPNIIISHTSGWFSVRVIFDGPWMGASPPPEGVEGLMWFFGRYIISCKDILGHYYWWDGTSFFLVTFNVIVHKL